jgi:hypothetical protein
MRKPHVPDKIPAGLITIALFDQITRDQLNTLSGTSFTGIAGNRSRHGFASDDLHRELVSDYPGHLGHVKLHNIRQPEVTETRALQSGLSNPTTMIMHMATAPPLSHIQGEPLLNHAFINSAHSPMN